MSLTPKQENFCREYIRTGNATESYKRAYDTKKMKAETINRNAFALLKNNKITTRIKELDEKKENSKIADAKEIQEFLTKVMRGEVIEEVPMIANDEIVLARKKATPKDSIKAGETLAKMRGYFDIKIKIENTPIVKDDI